MKRLLKADLFELGKSKMVYILPIGAVLLGVLLPLMYYGIFKLFNYLAGLEALKDDPTFASAAQMLGVFDSKTVLRAVLPMSQGFGVMLAPMLGYRAVRPFATGIYRNKMIAGCPRTSIYLSQTLVCLMLAMVSAALYTLFAALTSRLTFGPLELTSSEMLSIVVLTFGVYLVYTALPVFVAFLTRSTPLTLIISMALPILMQTVISLVSPALINASDTVVRLMSAIPSFQSMFMCTEVENPVLAISLGADVVLSVLLTVFGILRFRKCDVA